MRKKCQLINCHGGGSSDVSDAAEPLMRKLLLIGVLVLLFQISTVTTMAVTTNNSEGTEVGPRSRSGATGSNLASNVSNSLVSVRPPRVTGTFLSSQLRFLQQPEPIYYIIKNKPVTIVCRTVGAKSVHFKCASQWMSPTRQKITNCTDDVTGLQCLKASVDINKEEVDEFSAGFRVEPFWCECHAFAGERPGSISRRQDAPPRNNPSSQDQAGGDLLRGNIFPSELPRFELPVMEPGTVKISLRTQVHVAYLRKMFDREPLSASVELYSLVQLQCLPPEGVPLPETFWLKNNEQIDALNEINYIITSEGDLIINRVELDHQANYTCGAQNIANRRLSEPAVLLVHVSGGWSAWSSWSDCPFGCGKNQRRTRTCSNPAPVNGGPACTGEAIQRQSCSKLCSVDGSWSVWSSWSPCGPNCKQHRRRMCDNPTPTNGGKDCLESDLDTTNCSVCDEISTFNTASAVGGAGQYNIVLYAGLGLALVIMSSLIVVTIIIIRRKRHSPSKNSVVKLPPDITQTVAPFLSSESRYAAERTLDYCPEDDVMSCQLLYQRAPHLCETENSTESGYRKFDKSDNKLDVTASCHDPIGWAHVGHEGGRIDLQKSGVSLVLPEGAVKRRSSVNIFLVVLREDRDRPQLSDMQTQLSSVVAYGGPTRLTLLKPAVVTFQHCAHLESDRGLHWVLALYGCELNTSKWQRLCVLEGNKSSSADCRTYVRIEPNLCHVISNHPMRYALIGQPRDSGSVFKTLQLATFGPVETLTSECALRVYFVQNTWDALESIVAMETRLGCRLLDSSRTMPFEFAGGDLCIALDVHGYGWSCKRSLNYQEVPFRHIWSGTQSCLHCSFVLEYVGHNSNFPVISGVIEVYQKNRQEHHQTITIGVNFATTNPSVPVYSSSAVA